MFWWLPYHHDFPGLFLCFFQAWIMSIVSRLLLGHPATGKALGTWEGTHFLQVWAWFFWILPESYLSWGAFSQRFSGRWNDPIDTSISRLLDGFLLYLQNSAVGRLKRDYTFINEKDHLEFDMFAGVHAVEGSSIWNKSCYLSYPMSLSCSFCFSSTVRKPFTCNNVILPAWIKMHPMIRSLRLSDVPHVLLGFPHVWTKPTGLIWLIVHHTTWKILEVLFQWTEQI